MMELTDFPNEILHLIISQILLNSDVAKVTLVSRRFKTLAEPLLYRSIHFEAEPLGECRLGVVPILKRTDQLIANLKARPELGTYTTAFALKVTHPPWYQSYPQVSIIKRMPKLRQLSYDPPALHGGGIPAECKHLAALRFDFTHVTNHYDEDCRAWLEHGIPLEIIAKYLWHPSLRRIQAEKVLFTAVFEYETWLVLHRMRYGPSPVEDLRFLECCERTEYRALTAFINSVRKLRCFVFEMEAPRKSRPVPNHPPCGIDFRPALHSHSATIEDLALSTSDHALDLVRCSGSFIYWTALKRLAVPFPGDFVRHAMLHEFLPPQLEELQLENKFCTASVHEVLAEYEVGAERIFSPLWELAVNKQARVPGLKWLIWWLQYPSGHSVNGDRYRLRKSTIEMLALEIFRFVGVKFELVLTPFFKETPLGKELYKW